MTGSETTYGHRSQAIDSARIFLRVRVTAPGNSSVLAFAGTARVLSNVSQQRLPRSKGARRPTSFNRVKVSLWGRQ